MNCEVSSIPLYFSSIQEEMPNKADKADLAGLSTGESIFSHFSYNCVLYLVNPVHVLDNRCPYVCDGMY